MSLYCRSPPSLQSAKPYWSPNGSLPDIHLQGLEVGRVWVWSLDFAQKEHGMGSLGMGLCNDAP